MITVFLNMLDEDSDKDKFEKLYTKYKGLMISCAYDILKDYHLTEDIVQEAFIKIAKNINNIDDIYSSRTRTYIVTITENTAINMYKHKHRAKTVSIQDITLSTSDISLIIEAKLEEENPKNEVRLLVKALGCLSEKYSLILRDKFMLNMSYKDIAKQYGITQATARKRIERGKRLLYDIMAKGSDCNEENEFK